MSSKIEHLIVDTSAFIKEAPLQDIGINIVTAQEVVDEIKNKRQLRRLVALPYDLQIREVFPENIKFVSDFSKKTGDYRSLSATDIKVIALTYQIEKEINGTEHINAEPKGPPKVNLLNGKTKGEFEHLSGFYIPKKSNKSNVETSDNEQTDEEIIQKLSDLNCDPVEHKSDSEEFQSCNEIFSEDNEKDSDNESGPEDCKTINKKNETLNENEEHSANDSESEDDSENKITNDYFDAENNDVNILIPVKSNSENNSCSDYESDDEDSDNGWITPGNVQKIKKEIQSEYIEEKHVNVACLTTDFAMQNVLKQIGLSVSALDGKVIRQLRTFIFRCYSCFKTTSLMTKVFCPNCGNKTLKKVAVSLDENGKQIIHINTRRPLTARGKKFSLPTPKGGKHANNPILFEDQPVPQQRPTKSAKIKLNPLDPDYIAGYSPFVMRDVNSKSAVLGIRSGSELKHWMRKNPNEARRKRK